MFIPVRWDADSHMTTPCKAQKEGSYRYRQVQKTPRNTGAKRWKYARYFRRKASGFGGKEDGMGWTE
jgi:hypothetical protein